MKAILLASGMSTRMGAQKLLLPFCDGTMIERVLDNVLNGCPDGLLLVASQAVLPAVARYASARVCILVNEHPEWGQSASLRLGLSALSDDEDFFVALGDMPRVEGAQIRWYAERFRDMKPGYTALAPWRDARPGHPVFFKGLWRARLLAASGDVGGRRVLNAHEDEVLKLRGFEGSFRDVDTREDYADILQN